MWMYNVFYNVFNVDKEYVCKICFTKHSLVKLEQVQYSPTTYTHVYTFTHVGYVVVGWFIGKL